jgi:hypothetical protein
VLKDADKADKLKQSLPPGMLFLLAWKGFLYPRCAPVNCCAVVVLGNWHELSGGGKVVLGVEREREREREREKGRRGGKKDHGLGLMDWDDLV